MCAGFPAGKDDAQPLISRTSEDGVYLEVGDRSSGDRVVYPDDDIDAFARADGTRCFTREDAPPD